MIEVARRAARARWFEARCFEVVGRWVTDTTEPAAKLFFARESHHHAWRADVFARLVPVASGFTLPDSPPPDGWVELLDALAAAPAGPDRLEGLVGITLPSVLGSYERWRDEADPVTDAPLVRWLSLVIHDLGADVADGETVWRGIGSERGLASSAACTAVAQRAGPLV